MNKTKEEILKEVIYEFPQLGIKAGQLYDNTGRHATIDVYGAMDQWADQQSSSLKEENQKLREALEELKELVRQINAGMIHFSTLDKMPTLDLLDRKGVIAHVVKIGKDKVALWEAHRKLLSPQSEIKNKII